MEPGIYENLLKIGKQWLARLLLLFGIFEVILTLISILGLPGSISLNRFFLLSFPFLLGLVVIYLFLCDMKNPTWIPDWIQNTSVIPRKGRCIRSGLWVGVIILWAVAFLPFSDLGRWGAFYFRLQPILILAFLLFMQSLICWLFFTRTLTNRPQLEIEKPSIIAGAVLGTCIFIIFLVVKFTGLGIGVGTQYWGKAGVPILHWQIAVSLGIGLSGLYLAGRLKNLKMQSWMVDLVLFTGLWVGAFLIWQAIPIDVSRFTTQLYPPNYVSYPYSDAGDYVLSAEAILLGNGFHYGFIDKPLHQVFLVLIRLLAGPDFAAIVVFQVACLAFMPGLVYLIGSRISNQSAGLIAGLIILFMQSNSLSAINRIQVSNVKMMMSEPLTAMMLMLVCLAVIDWWKKPDGSWVSPALAGALLSLSGLVRMNTLVIAPFIAGVWLVSFGIKKRGTWISALVFALFCFLSLVPWMARNQIVIGDPLASVTSKTEGVLLHKRFDPIMEETLEETTQTTETDPFQDKNSGNPKIKGIIGLFQPMMHTGFHNLLSVGLVLPASWVHTGLDDTIRFPYWDQEWDGTFNSGGQVVFVLSMLLVLTGFVTGWQKQKLIPIIPLIILVSYLVSNSISLVSGGRYIAPVDWILPMYYSIGLAAVFIHLMGIHPVPVIDMSDRVSPAITRSWVKPKKLVYLILLIACFPAFLSFLIPKKYIREEPVKTLGSQDIKNIQSSSAFSLEEIQNFSKTTETTVFRGQAMFPRWMKTGIGDTAGSGSAFSALPFDHLSFSMLSYPNFPFSVMLPINEPVAFLPNASEVIIVGCTTKTYFDAAIVIVLSPAPVVYSRPDITKLECPLPKP